jgi:hypothetical protein
MASELAGLYAGMMGFIVGYFIFALAAYIYAAIAFMTMAKSKGIPNGWLAFIPIANVYLMTQIGGIPWWWLLLCLVPIVNIFAVFYILWKVCEGMGRPGWWALLTIIPMLGLIWGIVMVGLLAWGHPEGAGMQPTTPVQPQKPAPKQPGNF